MQIRGKDELIANQMHTIDDERVKLREAEKRAKEHVDDADAMRSLLRNANERVRDLEIEVSSLHKILKVVGHAGNFDIA